MRDDTKLNYLWEWVNEIKKKIADNTAYTPPGYSSTDEVNTGQKWIDGKDIYTKVFTGNSPASDSVTINLSFDTLISINGIIQNSQSLNYLDLNRNIIVVGKPDKSGLSILASSQTVYQNVPYNFIVCYTKPDPVPANASRDTEDLELVPVEEKKTKTRKTTKKEEE